MGIEDENKELEKQLAKVRNQLELKMGEMVALQKSSATTMRKAVAFEYDRADLIKFLKAIAADKYTDIAKIKTEAERFLTQFGETK